MIGEAGGPQYEVYAAHGKGVFSSVLRARDLLRRRDDGTYPEVAIKVRGGREGRCRAGPAVAVGVQGLVGWSSLPAAGAAGMATCSALPAHHCTCIALLSPPQVIRSNETMYKAGQVGSCEGGPGAGS